MFRRKNEVFQTLLRSVIVDKSCNPFYFLGNSTDGFDAKDSIPYKLPSDDLPLINSRQKDVQPCVIINPSILSNGTRKTKEDLFIAQ